MSAGASKPGQHRLLLMLDEFPALGRLDFFESALAFMAGYGIKAFLIAQSLNQIEKAYGPNNAILDNCHVRVAFATNDERTAKRVSDALGTATELRNMKNYAGHRLAPWLAHVMVSRQEMGRPLLTPGEVMQLPPSDEVVMVAGAPPVRARKARYYEDRDLAGRVRPAPKWLKPAGFADRPPPRPDDWTGLAPITPPRPTPSDPAAADPANGGLRQEPELSEHEAVVAPVRAPADEFALAEDEPDDEPQRQRTLASVQRRTVRLAALDRDDGLDLGM